MEYPALFVRAFQGQGIAATAFSFRFVKSGAHLDMSLLTLPLSDDGAAVNMTVSTLAARSPLSLVAKRGWLKGLPIKVCHVLDVGSAQDLGKLCLDWVQRGESV